MTASGALARVIRRTSAPEVVAEHCDVCGVGLPEAHRHMLGERSGELRCACQACSVLFERDAAAQGRYRLVPTQRRRLPELPLAELGLPVGLAFMVARPDGTATAHYPSPAGATRWDIDAEAWHRVTEACPQLAELEPDVQALLVNSVRGNHEYWIVPIDDCYRLVAVIRREWRGLSGGATVRPAIEEFFAGLAERSTRV